MKKASRRSLQFTPAELAEIKRRQREHEKLIAKLAATTTLEEQQALADELCPKFDGFTLETGSSRRPHARSTASSRS